VIRGPAGADILGGDIGTNAMSLDALGRVADHIGAS
jgi:hypothetical protein